MLDPLIPTITEKKSKKNTFKISAGNAFMLFPYYIPSHCKISIWKILYFPFTILLFKYA